MKNILIINAHWNNRGDQAAIYAMLDELLCVLKLRETGDMQKGTSRSPGTSCNQVKDADCRLVPLDEDLARAVPFLYITCLFYF